MYINSPLDELEAALKDALARLRVMADENAALRAELADRSERMRVAGSKLRVVAERLPKPVDAAITAAADSESVARIKAA